MSRRELREWMERLADRYHLRRADKGKCYLGIHEGILVNVAEWDGVVTLKLGSPEVDFGAQILEHFAGFAHCAGGGLPTSWINPMLEQDGQGGERVSHHFCYVEIDGRSLERLGSDRAMEIPELVTQDLHALGAPEVLTCTACGQNPASTLALVNYEHAPFCETCWQDLQFQAPSGRLRAEQAVRWPIVVPCLFALTVLGAVAWGFVQRPERVDRLGSAVYAIPLGWAFFLIWAIASVSGGVSRLLRIAFCGSVLLSVLAGNIWGYRSFAIQQMEARVKQPVEGPNLADSVRLYIEGLPQIWTGEAPFFLGGLFGAWVGLRFLKSQETIQLQ